MSNTTQNRKWYQRFKLSASQWRQILLFLLFAFISLIFWCILTFNAAITVDLEVPLNVTAKPTNVRFLTRVPDTLTVTMHGTASSFLKYLFKDPKPLEVRFKDYSDGENTFKIDSEQLKKLASRILSNNNATVTTVLPWGITATFTDLPGKQVPVIPDIDIAAAMGSTQNGIVTISPDSVMLYGDSKTLSQVTEVYTYRLQAHDLSDTLVRKVSISPIKGAITEPRSVTVTIPIAPLITKQQPVVVTVRNTPPGVKLIVFPSTVDVTFSTTMSRYRSDAVISAVVDYSAINWNNPSHKVPVILGEIPGAYQNVHVTPDSVEYIIEKH